MNLLKPQQDSEPGGAGNRYGDGLPVGILCALMDGRGNRTQYGRQSPSTTSGHLPGNGLVVCLAQGATATARRARILRLLKNLMGVYTSAKTLSSAVNLRYARTCYDHLAGELAVTFMNYAEGKMAGGQMADPDQPVKPA